VKCDICGGPGPKENGDGLLGRVVTLCVECMNAHLREKARRARVARPSVDLRSLAMAMRSASLVPARRAIHGKG
jgi:hypothetical protein